MKKLQGNQLARLAIMSCMSTCDASWADSDLMLARLLALRDPNVEILYISPYAVESEGLDYYRRLLKARFDKTHTHCVGREENSQVSHMALRRAAGWRMSMLV